MATCLMSIYHLRVIQLNLYTIYFFNSIQGDTQYTHRGDRSRDGIIEFAKRALG